MGRQAGYYEWDDDSLTPGMKKEGGWSQNLFDEDGRLKANARFVPTDEDFEFSSGYVTDTMYISSGERQLREEDKELARLLALAVSNLIGIGIERAKPHVKRWWNETAWPSIKETASKISRPRPRLKAAEVLAEAKKDTVSSDQVVEVSDEERMEMSPAEAQARLIAAAAARAYSDQQMRLVTNANIVDANGVDDIRRQLAQLPQEQLAALIEHMMLNPAALEEESLANLASLLQPQRQLQ
ncbi:hypothetical protein QP405_03385 [Gleimia europaea]|uniref:hypothetical protein n=1 Tax=Actinomycetaceae TaxID=2049 RepID=UPI0022E729B0|nr:MULTISPECIES: hypothetical protein [Actinomycetaceae]MDK7142904.1 hypothetical protein [Gleimia europaea]